MTTIWSVTGRQVSATVAGVPAEPLG